jgi:hypothetical protein
MSGDPPIEIPGSSEFYMRERAADKLAYEVALAIHRRELGERSGISDALLNYLNIGGIGWFDTVPEWIEWYEKREADN